MLGWRFKHKQPDDTTRDPISSEFFSTEAIRNAAQTLVRAGVQNSLDARVAGGRARIRMFNSGTQCAAVKKRSQFRIRRSMLNALYHRSARDVACA